MKSIGIYIVAFVCLLIPTYGRTRPHYTFILPDGYVGWVQIVFSDPQALPLPFKNHAYEIEVPESGVPRTSDIRVHDFKRTDEFYYRTSPTSGKVDRSPVPVDYVMPGDSHGGFGVMDTGGKGSGYSWFIFVGPPELRAIVPLADYEKVIASYKRPDGSVAPMPNLDKYPIPGRMPMPSPK